MQRIAMYLLLIVALFFVVLFYHGGNILAQGATPTPDVIGDPVIVDVTTPTPTPVVVVDEPPNPIPVDDPTEPPATTPETLLGQLFALLKDATYMVWAAAGVIVIVGALKTVLSALGVLIADNTAIVITLIVQVLIWLAYAAANYFNQGEVFKAWYLQIVDVIRSLLPLFGAIFLGHIGFQAAAKRKVPVLGYNVQIKAK